MPRKPKPGSTRGEKPDRERALDSDIRIIGGDFRGRLLRYHGDPVVRPMKHRVREAMYNLLGPVVTGRHAIDLFAGTGALALEALSRGAAHATLIERHVPTARVIEENIRTLGVADRTTLLITSTFLWAKRDLAESYKLKASSHNDNSALDPQPSTLDAPWLVFCSPPYDFFVDRLNEMLDLIERIKRCAPSTSVLVVESDERFDFALLESGPASSIAATDSADSDDSHRRVRAYPPAVIGIWTKG